MVALENETVNQILFFISIFYEKSCQPREKVSLCANHSRVADQGESSYLNQVTFSGFRFNRND